MHPSDDEQKQFTSRDVKIISRKALYQGFFSMVKCTFKHKLFAGGWSPPIEREIFERGRAAALLPYDPIEDKVVLIEQIRVGALETTSPWQLEIVAGIIESGESSEDVVRREALEEAGIKVGKIESIVNYFPSSGGCSEKLDVYVGLVAASSAHGIHGLDYEGEDIKVHVMSRSKAYSLINDGKIENSASIIALQWLELHHEELRNRWK